MKSRLLFASTLLVSVASPALADESRTIVVTGRSLKSTKAELEACLARHCPPDEDIRATLAHAENAFVAGDYKQARGTLLASASRNRGEAKSYPVPVSDLMRASARVAAHLGEGDAYRLATLDSRDALKAGLAKSDPRILASTLEVGDMRARFGFPQEADRIYRDVAKDALAMGNPALASYAELRRAFLELETSPGRDSKKGRDQLSVIAASVDPATRGARLAAKVLLARLDRKTGNGASTDALLAEAASLPDTGNPLLLSFDAIKQPESPFLTSSDRGVSNQRAARSFEGQWVDIGFWIKPDGKPGDIEIVRQGGRNPDWTMPVIASIASRLYAPRQREAGDPGSYAVERYTLTSFQEYQLGTRIRQRSSIPRIERLDLTPDAPSSAGVAKPSGTRPTP